MWRETTGGALSGWLGKRADRRALIVRSAYVLGNPGVLASDIAQAFRVHTSSVSDGAGAIALEGRTDDKRVSIFQATGQFLAGPDTGVIPKWGAPGNDQHQFVPNFGVALGVKLSGI